MSIEEEDYEPLKETCEKLSGFIEETQQKQNSLTKDVPAKPVEKIAVYKPAFGEELRIIRLH